LHRWTNVCFFLFFSFFQRSNAHDKSFINDIVSFVATNRFIKTRKECTGWLSQSSENVGLDSSSSSNVRWSRTLLLSLESSTEQYNSQMKQKHSLFFKVSVTYWALVPSLLNITNEISNSQFFQGCRLKLCCLFFKDFDKIWKIELRICGSWSHHHQIHFISC
jgi:hypothetical protein